MVESRGKLSRERESDKERGKDNRGQTDRNLATDNGSGSTKSLYGRARVELSRERKTH